MKYVTMQFRTQLFSSKQTLICYVLGFFSCVLGVTIESILKPLCIVDRIRGTDMDVKMIYDQYHTYRLNISTETVLLLSQIVTVSALRSIPS